MFCGLLMGFKASVICCMVHWYYAHDGAEARHLQHSMQDYLSHSSFNPKDSNQSNWQLYVLTSEDSSKKYTDFSHTKIRNRNGYYWTWQESIPCDDKPHILSEAGDIVSYNSYHPSHITFLFSWTERVHRHKLCIAALLAAPHPLPERVPAEILTATKLGVAA